MTQFVFIMSYSLLRYSVADFINWLIKDRNSKGWCGMPLCRWFHYLYFLKSQAWQNAIVYVFSYLLPPLYLLCSISFAGDYVAVKEDLIHWQSE